MFKKFLIIGLLLISSFTIAPRGYCVVQSTNNKVTYTAGNNNTTTHFGYTFPIIASSDIKVYITDLTGVATLITSNYSVDTVNAEVIYPTSGSPLAAGYKITLMRVVPFTQLLSLSNQGAFNAANVMAAFDKAVMLSQQLQEQLNRSIIGDVTQTAQGTLPYPMANMLLGWNTAGTALVNVNNPAASAILHFDNINSRIGINTSTPAASLHNAGDFITEGPWADVRAYGAKGDNSTDDTTAIQDAIDAISATGGIVFIPAGNYKLTSALQVPQQVHIIGAGAEVTNLKPRSCIALDFVNSDGIGPINIRDFSIYGDGNTSESTGIGIRVLGDATTASRVTGLRIHNVRIHYLNTAVYLRAAWDPTISDCVFNHVFYGVRVIGQSTDVKIRDNYMVHDASMGVSGNGIGVECNSAFDYDPGGATEHRPEAVFIEGNVIYGFYYGVSAPRGMVVKVENNDIDFTSYCGIRFDAVDDITAENNFIGLYDTTATYGILLNAIGSTSIFKANIENNTIYAESTPNAGSDGIYAGSLQNFANISNNTISGMLHYDINCVNVSHLTLNGNTCLSSLAQSIYIDSTCSVVSQLNNYGVNVGSLLNVQGAIESEKIGGTAYYGQYRIGLVSGLSSRWNVSSDGAFHLQIAENSLWNGSFYTQNTSYARWILEMVGAGSVGSSTSHFGIRFSDAEAGTGPGTEYLGITYSGAINIPSLTASKGVFTDASKNLISASAPMIYSGTNAPSSTPLQIGNEYVDTTNKKIYFSTGTSSSSDWTIVN